MTGCACVMAIVSWWKRDLSKMDGSVLILRFSMFSWLFATLLLFALTAATRWTRGAILEPPSPPILR